MHPILKNCRILLNPFPNPIIYLANYIHLAEQVVLYKHHRYKFAFHLLNLLLAIKSAHFFYLAFYSSGTDLEETVQFDSFKLLLGKPQINWMAIVSCAMLVYYNVCIMCDQTWRYLRG